MKFDAEQMERILHHLGFNHYPRTLGNPRQEFVLTTDEIYPRLVKWDGLYPCFISTGGYDDLRWEVGGKQSPGRIIHEMTFFDFDHDNKPENAFADVQRLSQFLRSMDIAHWVQYSGSKGYHLFIMHEPTKFRFSHLDGSADALKHLINQTQTHLAKTLGLNTLDEQTTGDPKRLCRIPFTRHVNRHLESSGRFAVPIDVEKLDEISHEDIVKSAYRPQYFLPNITGRKITLAEFIDELGIRLHAPETQIRDIIKVKFDFDSSAKQFLASLAYRCPGVVNELKRRNPPHSARVFSALFAKTLNYTPGQFEDIWSEMGEKIGYVDLHNKEHRLYQISTLFNNPKYRSFPNCSTLKAKGCCIGETCPRWKTFMGVGDAVRIERKWRSKDGRE
jgi:hypothetical protein